jgi:hypothetical protein
MSLYKGQSLLTITLDCGTDLTSATTTRILYRKPSGGTGYWTASASGTELSYTLNDNDIDESGTWQLQGYVIIGGKTAYSEIINKQFNEPIL